MSAPAELSLAPRPCTELRCVYCHGPLGARRTSCPECGTRLHPECARLLDRCPTLGCECPWPYAGELPPAAGCAACTGPLEELEAWSCQVCAARYHLQCRGWEAACPSCGAAASDLGRETPRRGRRGWVIRLLAGLALLELGVIAGFLALPELVGAVFVAEQPRRSASTARATPTPEAEAEEAPPVSLAERARALGRDGEGLEELLRGRGEPGFWIVEGIFREAPFTLRVGLEPLLDAVAAPDALSDDAVAARTRLLTPSAQDLPWLIQDLASRESGQRLSAARAVERYGAAAVPDLVAALESDAGVAAGHVLGRLGADAVPALEEAFLRQGCLEAALVLENMGGLGVGPLARALDFQSDRLVPAPLATAEVRAQAARSLGRMGEEAIGVLSVLEEARSFDGAEAVRDEAFRAVDRILNASRDRGF